MTLLGLSKNSTDITKENALYGYDILSNIPVENANNTN